MNIFLHFFFSLKFCSSIFSYFFLVFHTQYLEHINWTYLIDKLEIPVEFLLFGCSKRQQQNKWKHQPHISHFACLFCAFLVRQTQQNYQTIVQELGNGRHQISSKPKYKLCHTERIKFDFISISNCANRSENTGVNIFRELKLYQPVEWTNIAIQNTFPGDWNFGQFQKISGTNHSEKHHELCVLFVFFLNMICESRSKRYLSVYRVKRSCETAFRNSSQSSLDRVFVVLLWLQNGRKSEWAEKEYDDGAHWEKPAINMESESDSMAREWISRVALSRCFDGLALQNSERWAKQCQGTTALRTRQKYKYARKHTCIYIRARARHALYQWEDSCWRSSIRPLHPQNRWIAYSRMMLMLMAAAHSVISAGCCFVVLFVLSLAQSRSFCLAIVHFSFLWWWRWWWWWSFGIVACAHACVCVCVCSTNGFMYSRKQLYFLFSVIRHSKRERDGVQACRAWPRPHCMPTHAFHSARHTAAQAFGALVPCCGDKTGWIWFVHGTVVKRRRLKAVCTSILYGAVCGRKNYGCLDIGETKRKAMRIKCSYLS